MKKIFGWVLVAVLMAAIPLAYATVVKDKMKFEGQVQATRFVHKFKTIGTATTYTHTVEDGDVLLVNKTAGLASLTVTLPTITSDLDGYVLIVKQIDSGTTDCALTPVSGQYIEMTRGTASGASDYSTDAAGDAKAFMARYGTTCYWYQLWANQT